MRNRIEELKIKNEVHNYATPVFDYSQIKIGKKILEDATLMVSELKKTNPNIADKEKVLKAINSNDIKTMREISDFFFKTSGIYSRILRYMAFMYRYDWMVTPYVQDSTLKEDKIKSEFYKVLTCLDEFYVKKNLGDIALKVLKVGAYYGYIVPSNNSFVLQELPANYCRSNYNSGSKPAVEFNMRYFDDRYRDAGQRMRILQLFPPEFLKGYRLFKEGKLPAAEPGDQAGWYLLDTECTVRFTLYGEEFPPFISVIPLILDLDSAQALDRQRAAQRLLRLIVQRMPLDKNNEMVFDPAETREYHNNAVGMLHGMPGVSVLTTLADVSVENMADSGSATTQSDDLEKVERQVYNEAGVSQLQFNSDGQVAVQSSLLNDAATMQSLLWQFEMFLNRLIEPFNKNSKKLTFKVELLTTTIYNYQELSKLYKEQVTLGYSKMVPPIALGRTQSAVLASAYFENDILNLSEIFIPPMQSSVMNADSLAKIKAGKGGGNAVSAGEDNKGGRPTNESQGKPTSDKTLQNKESIS